MRKVLSILLVVTLIVAYMPNYSLIVAAMNSADEDKTVSISNDYLELVVLSDKDNWARGRYYLKTTGGHPYYTEDDNQLLLEKHFDESYYDNFRIMVDTEQIPFIVDDDSEIMVDDEKDIVTSTMTYDGLIITQKLEFVDGYTENVEDMLKISYTYDNTSDITHTVGGVLILDTAIGENAGPFYEVKTKQKESYSGINQIASNTNIHMTEYEDIDSDPYDCIGTWKTMEGDNQTLVGYSEVNTFGQAYKTLQFVDIDNFFDKYDIYKYSNKYGTLYDYGRYICGYSTSKSRSLLENSGVVYHWAEQNIEKSKSLTFGTTYGLDGKGAASISDGSYTLKENSINNHKFDADFSINGQTEIYSDDHQRYSKINNSITTSSYREDVLMEKTIKIDSENDLVNVTYKVTNEGSESCDLSLTARFENRYNYYVEGIGEMNGTASYAIDKVNSFQAYTGQSGKYYTIDTLDVSGIGETASEIGFYRNKIDQWHWSSPYAYINWNSETLEPNESKVFTYTYTNSYDTIASASKFDYLVSVVDEYGKPVEYAEVKKDNHIYYTDKNGNVSFTASVYNKALTIGKKYYYTQKCSGLDPGETLLITLYRNTDDPFINSLKYEDTDGRTVDLLKKNSSLYLKGDKRDSVTFTFDGDFGDYEASSYEVIQKGKVIASSSTENVTIDLDDFKVNTELYIRIRDNQGKESKTEEIGLLVLKEEAFRNSIPNLPGADFIVDGVSIAVKAPKSIPIIGGETVNIGIEDLISLDGFIGIAEDNTVQIAIGGNVASEEDLGKFKREFNKSQKASSGNSTEATKVPYASGTGSVSASIIGYGEGYVKDDIMYVDLSLIMEISGEYSAYYQIAIGYVPVYFDGSLAAAGGVIGTYDLTYDDVHGWELNGVTGATATLEAEATLGAGVGVKQVATVGGEAAISLYYEYNFTHKRQKLTATGSLAAKVTAFMFSAKEVIKEKTWTLYNSSKAVSNKENNNFLASSQDFVYDQDNYSLIGADDYNQLESLLTLASIDYDLNLATSDYNMMNTTTTEGYIYEQDIYEGTLPRLINYGGNDYLFYIQDDSTRDTANRAKFVYMTRDEDNGRKWTGPITIDADGTADYNFDIAIEPEDDSINVVWQDMTKVFDDSVEMSDITDNVIVSFAKISTTDGAIKVDEISTEGDYATMPQVSTNKGKTMVSWFENDSHDIFGLSGTNTLKQVDVTTTSRMTVEVIDSTDEIVVSMDAGIIDGKTAIVYELDLDEDITTIEDREIYLVQEGTRTRLTDDDIGDMKPKFVAIDGNDVIMWYKSNNLCYIKSAAGDMQTVFTSDHQIANDVFEVISNKSDTNKDISDTKIIWSEPSKENTDTWNIMASDLVEGDTWSDSYVLENNEWSEFKTPNGYINDDEELEIMYGDINRDTDEWSIELLTIKPTSNIAITDVSHEEDNVVLGQDLDVEVTLENIGQKNIENAEIEILYNDKVISSKTITDKIIVRESLTSTLSISVADDLTMFTGYVVKVNISDDEDESDNELDLLIGYTDLSLESEILFDRGTKYASLTVTNLSEFPSDASLIITQDSLEGEVVASYELTDLDNENFTNVLVNMTKLMDNVESNLFYAYIESENEEYYTYNNSQMIYFAEYSVEEDTDINSDDDEDTDSTIADDIDSNSKKDDDDDGPDKYFDDDELTIDLSLNPTVDIKVFEELKDIQGGHLTLVGQGYTYRFTSNGVYHDMGVNELDFSTNLNNESKGNDIVKLKSMYAGELPMECELTVDLGETFKNEKIYISYIDDETGALSLLRDVESDALGSITFTLKSNYEFTFSANIPLNGNLFKDDVKDITLIHGYKDRTVRPDNAMTRVELAYILDSLIKPSMSEGEFNFTDVGSWAEKAVNNMVSYNFMSGFANGTFNANEDMTRLDFVNIIYKMLSLETLEGRLATAYDDVDESIDDTAINALTEIGLIVGSGNSFRPYDYITRAEVITIMNRLLATDTSYKGQEMYFTDLPKEHWAYNQVMGLIK